MRSDVRGQNPHYMIYMYVCMHVEGKYELVKWTEVTKRCFEIE